MKKKKKRNATKSKAKASNKAAADTSSILSSSEEDDDDDEYDEGAGFVVYSAAPMHCCRRSRRSYPSLPNDPKVSPVLQQFSDAQWTRFLTQVRAVHDAALFQPPLAKRIHVCVLTMLAVVLTIDSWPQHGGALTILLVILFAALSVVEWSVRVAMAACSKPIWIVPLLFGIAYFEEYNAAAAAVVYFGIFSVYVLVFLLGVHMIKAAREELHPAMQEAVQEWLHVFANAGYCLEYIVDEPAGWWRWSESYLLIRKQHASRML